MSRFNSLVVCAIFAMFAAFHLAADTATVNGITWTYTISNGEASLGLGDTSSPAVPKSTAGALALPSTLGGCPVTSIGSYAFCSCANLTCVTIPDSVTSIGWCAFQGCTGLTSVTIPDSVTRIEINVFKDCSGLTSVTIPDSVASIGGGAFSGCTGLTSVTIGSGVMSIEKHAFKGCSGLTSVTIPDSVASIGSNAFDGCYGLRVVNIADIAAWCRISFGDTYSDHDANPLSRAQNLYVNGESIVNLVIPDGVTSIGNYAFYNCTNITSVTIPDSVVSVGTNAFYNCSGLADVYISDVAAWCGISLGDSERNPFASPFYYAHNLYLNGELIESLVVPEGVASIGRYAFYNCTNFTSVTIPNSVTSIAAAAFHGCSGLTNVSIPDSVTSIGATAFYGCSGIMNVTIPSRWALSDVFANSYTKILSVNVPSGSTSVVNGAFKGCIALEDVSIPDTVTSIGDEAFYNCSSLQQLTLPDGVTSYGVNCFEGCPAYTRALYRALFSGSSGGGSPLVVTTVVQQVEAPYALSSTAADRAIASVAVSGDCSIGSFVLKDGKVYDTMMYVSNTADHEVSLSLPSGYFYKTIKGATPLTIPASSQCIISITRVDANTFLVMREELADVK